MSRFISSRGRQQLVAFAVAVAVALGVIAAPQAATAELCFNQPGVTACVAPEFRAFWEQNGGLAVFGYPQEAAKQENGFLVQYFERQRLELHPENAAPYNILLGRVNADALKREGRDWFAFPQKDQADAGCVAFPETRHTVCGAFLRYWRSRGLDLGDPGTSYRESLALWGLPLSELQTEQNVDGFTVMTQHFERARMELATVSGRQSVLLTRLGVELLPLHLKILAINDFHGQLSTGRKVAGKNVGGAAYLAAYIKQHRAQAQYSLTVHAGDMVGASEPVSALFKDQPTMEFMNMLGVDVGTSGNHEFDRGLAEYKRKVNGGCDAQVGCFKGVNTTYVTANVIEQATGKTIFPPYTIVNVNGARIGFIGIVLKDTPTIVTPSGVAGLQFLDEADTINQYVPELQLQGVRAIVVLIHQGGFGQTKPSDQLNGSIVEIAKKLNPEVDVLVAGHTHQFNNAMLNNMLITQAFSYSTAFADIDLTIDRAQREIVDKRAEIVTTFNDGVTPDPDVAALVKKYTDQVAPKINEVIGTAAETISATQNDAGESPLGNLIADAQRDAMGTQFGVTNPGGIRVPQIEAGPVTYAALFAAQPFANDVVKMKLTGDQLYQVLNQQWQPQSDGTLRTRFLQISGFAYTWSASRPIGDKIVEVRGPGGTPIDRGATYTIALNSFLSTGGDGFTTFSAGTEKVTGPVDLDALIQYVRKLPQPFDAKLEGRIIKQ